ncbi:STAS domain-containing protein [Desulfonema magnum]|uniref:STAS domain-containing protein n=1 Tax=Desulfonema magnum TaxID=45655 RepID=A0A975BN43_9BACT|nr:STAS domain-containing protein [Desulfonema magnum]QTA88059.1 STAS domain-containing protein [Desulfonema magnum]
MKTNIQDGTLTIILPPDCTIPRAESDTDKIRPLVSDDIRKIEVQAKSVEEMDTAYIQILLSLKTTADHMKIPFRISEMSPEVLRVSELHGAEF